MGVTQRLGTIPLAIFTDASNNIGIGGSPSGSYKFEVTGTATFSSSVTANASTNFTDVSTAADGNGVLITSNGVTAGAGAFGAGLVFSAINGSSRRAAIVPVQGTTDNDTVGLAFFTHTSATGSNPLVEAMRINYLGNVGIANTNPFSPLHINSNGAFSTSGNMTSGLIISNTNFGRGINIGVYDAGAYSYIQSAYVNNADTTFALALQPRGGNVGIGTSSPSALLTLLKDSSIGINTSDGSDNGYLALCGAGGDGSARGGHIYLSGNERGADAGTVVLSAGNVADGAIMFRTGAGTERMRITTGGALQLDQSAYFLCGTTGYRFNNSTNSFNNFVALDNGNATLRGTLTQNASDERLKNNIQLIPDALNKINSLRGVTFEWNQEIYETSRTTDIGVIAQDIQAVLPDAVTLAPFDTNFDDGTSKSGEDYLTVYYEKIIPLLIEGMKELSAKVSALENKS